MPRLWDPPEPERLFYFSSVCGSILFKGTWPEAEALRRDASMNLYMRNPATRYSTEYPSYDYVKFEVVPKQLVYTRKKTKERVLVRTNNQWRVFATLTHCAPSPRSKTRPKVRKGQASYY